MAFLKQPPRRVLKAVFRKWASYSQYSPSGTMDAYGQLVQSLVQTYNIPVEIQEITAWDLTFLVPGTAEIGDAWIFFLPEYDVKGQKLVVQPRDQVTWNGKTWWIDRIEEGWVGAHLWFKKALCRRVIPGQM